MATVEVTKENFEETTIGEGITTHGLNGADHASALLQSSTRLLKSMKTSPLPS